MEMGAPHFQSIFDKSAELRAWRAQRSMALAGDASNRSYFRVWAADSKTSSAARSFIVLCYGDARGPLFRQAGIPSQESALVELSHFFPGVNLPVPRLYAYDQEKRQFLFEDCGDRSLAQLTTGIRDGVVDALYDSRGPDWLERLFEDALTLVVRLQSVPETPKELIFRRWLTFENYRPEAQEFIDFIAQERGVSKAGLGLLARQFDALCETLMSYPRVPAHFDFHGHNILVRDDGALTLIDYQDACLVTQARDVVSLLNDRGMDEVLGQARHARLLKYFWVHSGRPSRLAEIYNATLLHWDFRVSGRFEKLCRNKKTEKYRAWIPGTLRRLGRTLMRCHRDIHGMEDVLELITKLSPEAKEGSEDPWQIAFSPA